MAVVVNLSLGKTNLHVAGCTKAEMDGPGSALLLPTKAYHRSGEASRRCIKLVFFFDIRPPIDLTVASNGEASTSGVKKEAEDEESVQVKPENSEN